MLLMPNITDRLQARCECDSYVILTEDEKNNLFIICSIGAEEFSARRSGLKVSNTAFSHFSVVVPKSGLAEMETKARHSVVCSFWRSNLYQEVDRA